MSLTIIFPIIGAIISVGGVFIAIGVFKGRINQNTESVKTQGEQIKQLASRAELKAAVDHIDGHIEASIKRSEELYKLIKDRAEEDRAKGQGQYREFYQLIQGHEKRISTLETQQNTILKSLDEMKVEIKGGFKELQNELKELRKQS